MSDRERNVAAVAGLLLALATSASATTVDIWGFSIWEDPNPPINEVPPITRGASRNKELLKYQIPGIVAGYVVFVAIFFFVVLTSGRRSRRIAQATPAPWSTEMVKPKKKLVDASPVSPSSFRSWTRWGKGPRSPDSQTQKSPTHASVVSFDPAVIEANKQQMEEEMGRIYAQVLAEETKAPRYVAAPEREVEPGVPHSPSHTRNGSISPRSFSQPRPPRLQLREQQAPPGPQSPSSPVGQRSVRAIHPPRDYYGGQQTPASATFPQTPASLYDAAPVVPFSPLSNAREESEGSERNHRRNGSGSSSRSKTTRSVRNLRISAPMPYHQYSSIEANSATTPLSPREYNPPAPPPIPPPLRSPTPIEDHDSDEDEETDAIVDTHRHRREDSSGLEAEDIIHAYAYGGLESPRPVPAAAPQRQAHQQQQGPVYTLPTIQTPGKAPGGAAAAAAATGGRVDNANAPLPFRAYTAVHPPPQYSQNSHAQGKGQSVFAPTPTKTTFISPRRDRFAPNRPQASLLSANALSPMRTGMSAPYSPYMPFTPMTPITPHLVTRNERRAREREERRAGGGMQTALDEVAEEKDMWGDAW